MVIKKIALAALLALGLGLPGSAADYFFKVNDLKAVLSVRQDGKVDIHYAITFTPETGSRPIDIVDIGMPNENYDLGSARASILGTALGDIRKSEYVKPGVEIHLGASAIDPGRGATLEFDIAVDRMVYPDSEDKLYASLQFKTTWYDGKYVSGTSERIEIQFNLPPGSQPDAVKYHSFGAGDYQPSETLFENGRVVYRWLWLGRPATVAYAAGASFPRSLVAAVYSPPRPSIFTALISVIVAFIAFVFSLSPLWIIGLVIFLAVRSSRRRMGQYLPPSVGIESGGIKRGLTPPEAALLQELPLAKVLLLVVFGLLKKERLSVKEISARDFRFQPLNRENLEPQEYETAFLAAIDKDGRLEKAGLRRMFTDMIAALQKKMAGFSRRETNMYYLSIMNKAWEQIKSCPRETLPAELAQALEWLALDPEYEDKLGQYTGDMVFQPGGGGYWYRQLPQRTAGSGGGAAAGTIPGQGIGGKAGALVQSLQVFSGALLGESAAFTSAVTSVTNPPPVQHYSSSGGHGGGGGCACACACACAGCACACAGGGR